MKNSRFTGIIKGEIFTVDGLSARERGLRWQKEVPVGEESA